MLKDSYTVHYEILGPTTNKWFSFVREVPNVNSLEEARKAVEDTILTEHRFKDAKGAVTVCPLEARILDVNLRRTFKDEPTISKGEGSPPATAIEERPAGDREETQSAG